MIVRVSEAHLREGEEEEFLARLTELVTSFPETYPGMLRHEILVDDVDARHEQYVSAGAHEGYAGKEWRTRPVTFPDEERFLSRPLELRHFVSVDIAS
ncbi:biotin carboxyl carrier protein [Microbacterium testaceum StLB037]|uniref:Biotin carboxyl carrier protein n=1 Tax=Microbacterium testaceum (strain StLB037) TaxID=979556 RepID=E8ND55_MICTS|nr:antibiotic biosynthesis monooxygenase [Microbacterium testaceum]BAJ73694.1 biotin carboxyl carrier protein [Microbacterium testaceum StLB037]